MKTYNVVNGTSYDSRTPQAVVNVLEAARIGGYRVRFHYGHTGDTDCNGKPCERGRDWMEECDTEGRIGRSMGPIKIPILLHNRRSMGGGGILDACILRIVRAKGGAVLYQSPDWKRPNLTVRPTPRPLGSDYRWQVDRDGENQARFRTEVRAHQYVKRFTGD